MSILVLELALIASPIAASVLFIVLRVIVKDLSYPSTFTPIFDDDDIIQEKVGQLDMLITSISPGIVGLAALSNPIDFSKPGISYQAATVVAFG